MSIQQILDSARQRSIERCFPRAFQSKSTEYLKEYAEDNFIPYFQREVDSWSKKAQGVLFICGETLRGEDGAIACAAIQDMYEDQFPGIPAFHDGNTLVRQLARGNDDSKKLRKKLKEKTGCLVIRNLGKNDEWLTANQNKHLSAVLSYREARGMPTIITTPYSPSIAYNGNNVDCRYRKIIQGINDIKFVMLRTCEL